MHNNLGERQKAILEAFKGKGEFTAKDVEATLSLPEGSPPFRALRALAARGLIKTVGGQVKSRTDPRRYVVVKRRKPFAVSADVDMPPPMTAEDHAAARETARQTVHAQETARQPRYRSTLEAMRAFLDVVPSGTTVEQVAKMVDALIGTEATELTLLHSGGRDNLPRKPFERF